MMDSPNKPDPVELAGIGQLMKKVQSQNIEQLTKKVQSQNVEGASFQPKTYNTRVASYLAIAIWIILGLVILLHLGATIFFSGYLITTDNSIELGEPVKQAYEMVNDTAKTLYSFLGTLTAAVSAYYFNTISRSQSDPPNE